MSGQATVQTQTAAKPTFTPIANDVLQRQCACGQHTPAGSECEECKKKREGTLQRAAINPALVHEALRSPGQSLDARTRAFVEPRFAHDFSQIPVHTQSPAGIQAKLTVTSPGDEYEQEADRVAHQVLNMPDAVATASAEPAPSLGGARNQTLQTKPLAAAITPFVQRQTLNNEETEDKEKHVQAKSAGSLAGSFMAGADVEAQVGQSKGRGNPLPDPVRAYMEPRFGADFSDVRIHTGSDALQMSQAVGAQAFTHGSDIYYGEGHSPTDLALAAHELTHVVQQGAAGYNAIGISVNNRGGAVQRRETEGEGEPLPSTESVTATPTTAAPAPTAAAPTAAAYKTTPLKIKAGYDDVPGASKTGAESAKQNSALWFKPLTIASLSPSADEVSTATGVSRGGGQLIETYHAPLNENPAEGTGMITAQLQYANDISKSYVLKGKEARDALIEAKKFVAEKITTLGDFDEIQRLASAYMTEKFPGSQTEITVSADKKVLADAGRSRFYYKARANPTILLNVPVVAVAEKTIRSGGTTVKTEGTETKQERHGEGESEKVDTTRTKTDRERHGESSVENIKQEYNEAVVKTIDDLVTSVTTVHNKLKSELVQKTISEFKYHDKDDWESHRVEGHFNDYTKNVKGYTESGEKDKKNWASWLQDGIKVVKDITDLPIISDIPKVGKYLRKLKGWGIALDIIDKGAGLFAETGKVKYTDSKEDTTVHDKGGTDDDTKVTRDRNVTRNDTTTTTRNLEESFDSTTNTEWKRHMDEVTTIKKTYSSVTTKDSAGGSDRVQTDDSTYNRNKESAGGSDSVKKNQSMQSTVTYDVTAKETFTKPVLQATVVDGDGEVSATPFPPPTSAPGRTKE
jgi:hypothetical protein